MQDSSLHAPADQQLIRLRRHKTKASILLRDCTIFLLLIVLAFILCSLLSKLPGGNEAFSVAIYILAVAMIARFTQGYLYGVMASILGTLSVNYFFTFPYGEFNMSISGYPLSFTSMLLVSICISALTSRMIRQEELRVQIETEKMRANLLRAVSHDLRTPLTSIIGSSSILLENQSIDSVQRAELLKEINRSARWLERITENILSVTKFSDGSVHLRTEYEVAEEIVASAIVKFHKTHASIPITIRHPEEILLAPMDATLIEQVLLNLFDNAVTHGHSTSCITVDIVGNAQYLDFMITDDGDGIASGILPHLFDGSLSAHRDDRRNMGIGLSVCSSIISAHRGTISARNIPGKGAQIEFILPVGKEEEHGRIEA